jgi:hypothetical protein
MRVALGGLNVDNIRGGATGNADAEVDVSTGALNGSFGTPVPGIEAIAGETLPDWEAACELVRRGARLMMPQRSFGWDVALTPHGPVLVEANRGYDPFPSRGFGELVRGMARATA